jgi:hypothetical protein
VAGVPVVGFGGSWDRSLGGGVPSWRVALKRRDSFATICSNRDLERLKFCFEAIAGGRPGSAEAAIRAGRRSTEVNIIDAGGRCAYICWGS